MSRSMSLAMVAALGACGTGEDERPLTMEVVTLTVLAPNCGQVQCHSTTTRFDEHAFDTVAEARLSLIDLGVAGAIQMGRPLEHDFMNVLEANGLERMPPDSPLADEDLDLIRAWLLAGGPGLQ